MDSWRLLFMWLCFKVVQTEASSWTIDVPSTVKGHPDSCVVIPCSFSYPNHKDGLKFKGFWKLKDHFVYHPDTSAVWEQYRGRTALLGDITHNNCSLKIEPLRQSDQGPFFFRIEIEHLNNFSYMNNEVSIVMSAKPDVAVTVPEDVTDGQIVVVHCSVSPSCPTSLPVFSWSHSGEESFHSLEFDDGQWKATAALTFRPTHADHNKPLVCTLRYSGGQQHEAYKLLKVKHAPVNVMVQHRSDVKEGEAVRLKCSSDAHPPARSYAWFSEAGARLHQGNVYVMPNVSRHVRALYCTAINTLGQGKSGLVQLSVWYAPEIKSVSSCSSVGGVVKCVCIVESKPPCMVHFVLSERVLPETKIERHGSVTIATVEAHFGSSASVRCLANNTEGAANLMLPLPVIGEMRNLYIAVAIAACVVLAILLTAVGLVKKCRGTSEDAATPHMSTEWHKQEELSEVKRKDENYDAAAYAVSDHVYGNMETDRNEAIYANM